MPANLQNAFADEESDDLPAPKPEEMVADVEQGGEPSAAALERDERERIAAEERAANPPEDERLAEGGEPEGDGEPEAETPHKRTARERREARKRHQRYLEDSIEQLRRENLELRQGFASLQGTSLQTQLSTVDARLSECLNDIDQADHLWLAARTANNPADELKAQKVRDEARIRAGNLQAEKERLASELTRQQNQPPPQLPAPQGDPVIAANAARFRADKPWIQYQRDGRPANQETLTATLIDQALKREGRLDPGEPKYWQELERRMQAAMPGLFPTQQTDEEEDDEELDEPAPVARGRPAEPANSRPAPQRRRGPAVGGSGRNSSGNRDGTRLSPEVVAAIKEAGWWEDPKERADAIKYFTGGK